MNKRALFIVSCLSLVTTSMSFAIRGDVANAMSAAFHITNEQMGLVFSPAFWAFAIAIVVGGALVDWVGMKRLHALSGVGYLVAVAMVVFAPRPDAPVASLFEHTGTTLLYVGFLIMGLSQGLVEGVINPLTITVYPTEKTKRLNVLHAWWPAGQIIGGLAAVFMTTVLDAPWELKLALIVIPAVVYLVMMMGLEYPATERVQSKVTTSEMWRETIRPLFLAFCVCHALATAGELGPDQWFPTVMSGLVPGLQGVLFLVYTAGLMFAIRTFGSGIAQRQPLGTMMVCGVLAFAGLSWLGRLEPGGSATVAFAAATLFGIGKTFFIPTMLGIASEQLPKGGALLMALMGGVGMLTTSVLLPIMGERIDRLGGGAALQMMAFLPAGLAVIFVGLWFYYRSKGGYRAVRLSDGH